MEAVNAIKGNITLSEVAEIKLIADAFFFHVLNLMAEARAGLDSDGDVEND